MHPTHFIYQRQHDRAPGLRDRAPAQHQQAHPAVRAHTDVYVCTCVETDPTHRPPPVPSWFPHTRIQIGTAGGGCGTTGRRATTTTRRSSTSTSRPVRTCIYILSRLLDAVGAVLTRGREGGREGPVRPICPCGRSIHSIYPNPQNNPTRADLSPAFDWNIKQLFVFLVVEYQSKKNVR